MKLSVTIKKKKKWTSHPSAGNWHAKFTKCYRDSPEFKFKKKMREGESDKILVSYSYKDSFAKKKTIVDFIHSFFHSLNTFSGSAVFYMVTSTGNGVVNRRDKKNPRARNIFIALRKK